MTSYYVSDLNIHMRPIISYYLSC